jgi:hypothetical protein
VCEPAHESALVLHAAGPVMHQAPVIDLVLAVMHAVVDCSCCQNFMSCVMAGPAIKFIVVNQ